MKIEKCYNFQDFKRYAKRALPSPVFHYIDGAADDEVTYGRNTKAYEEVDLVPSVLNDVENVDLSTTLFGKNLICHYIVHQRHWYLFHYDGERAVAMAAQKYGTMFEFPLGTVSAEEIEA